MRNCNPAPAASLVSPAVALLLSALAGCGGGSQGPLSAQQLPRQENPAPVFEALKQAVPAQSADSPLTLPSPSELARGASFAEGDRLQPGNGFDAGLPRAHVIASGPGGLFDPDGGKLDEAAFAIYSFSLAGYDGPAEVSTKWAAAPGVGDFYLGVADFADDTWQWFAGSASAPQALPQGLSFVGGDPAGSVFIAIVLTGSDQRTLDWVRVGQNIAPVADFSASPETGAAPLGVSFNAATSTDADGSIAGYDWDWEGDGVFDLLNGGASPTHNFASAGVYNVTLRVLDNNGAAGSFSRELTFDGAANLPPVADLQASDTTVALDEAVLLDAGASSDPEGSIARFDWDRDGDGVFEIADGGSNRIFSYSVAGDYNASVKVTDNLGLTDVASVLIQVSASSNAAPVAALTVDFERANENQDLQFDASGSTDSDGSIVKYEWDWDGNGSFDEDTGVMAQAAHSFTGPGQHTVSVRVTDNAAGTGAASVTFSIDAPGYDEVEPNSNAAAANDLQIASFTGFDCNLGDGGYDGSTADYYRLTITDPVRIAFTMSGFLNGDADLDMKLLTADEVTELRSSTSVTNSEAFTYTFRTPGTYLWRCYRHAGTVSDYMLSCSVDFDVAYDEVEPNNSTAQSNPLDPAGVAGLDGNLGAGGYDGGSEDFFAISVSGGSAYTFRADFSAADANIDLQLLGTDGTTEFGASEGSGGSESITHVFAGAGTYFLRAYIPASAPVDDLGDYVLTVTNKTGLQPNAAIGSDISSGDIALTVNFNSNGSSTPPGTTITAYEWDLDGSGSWETSTGTDPLETALYFRPGVYSATVRVTNDQGLSDTATLQITVGGALSEVEPNNAFGDGQTLPAMPFGAFFGDVGLGGNDGGDEDWYKITLAGAGQLQIVMDLYDPFLDIDLRLYDTDGTTELDSSVTTGDQEIVEYAIPGAGTYYLKVYRYVSTTNVGGAGYRLQGSFT